MDLNKPSQQQRQILSVSQLNRSAKDLLETYLPLLWVEGEISNLAKPSSGHWYFSLKDSRAQVRCAMFKGRNALLRFAPQAGQKVVCRARVSLYEGRGEFQLIVEHMEPAGLGDLHLQFEALKEKLKTEGLFDEQHKQELPSNPKRLGVVTSPSGAAIHDIIQVLKRRFPALEIVIYPCAVQGKDAKHEIAAAIARANRANTCDLLIVGRGGGSLEDLWAFNEEVVARAIFHSKLPIVSAVGHEVDFTIADFVADLRAPTPSAAAELISPSQEDWLAWLRDCQIDMSAAIRRQIAQANQQLRHLRARLRHPQQTLDYYSQGLDGLELRLKRAIHNQIRDHHQTLNNQSARLNRLSPGALIHQKSELLAEQQARLKMAMQRVIEGQQAQVTRNAQLLNSFSPLNVLSRGYAIALTEKNQVIKDANTVKPGQTLKTKLHRGHLLSRVVDIQLADE